MLNDHYSRHYYVSDSLDELETIEQELEAQDITYEQFHVLSSQDAEVSEHGHLHEVPSLLKRDIVRSTLKGATVGIILAPLSLFVVSLTNLTQSVGWFPFVFLALVILWFCTWEGGFIGIQTPNKDFVRFENSLIKGKHIFFVDIAAAQEAKLRQVLKEHSKLEPMGDGEATSGMVIQAQHLWHRFWRVFP